MNTEPSTAPVHAAVAPGREDDVLVLPAPAKLNLFLHVTGRRADGYHLLESLFVLLDFGDEITLRRRPDGAIARTTDLPGVPPERDLVVRAAVLLQQATGTGYGADIAVAKHIPAGGGLGGGSSDAATVLLGLNRLWGLGLGREALQALGLTLGADVPFFVFGAPALVRGIGERCTAVSVPCQWVAVVAPSVEVPTAAVFAAPELTRSTPSEKMEIFSEGYGRNDLQPMAAGRFPAVAAALAFLAKRSPAARMTGSGGCVFATCASEAEAKAVLADLPEELPGARGFVARSLSRHPLGALA